MASVHPRPRKDGSLAFRVSFRIDGRQAQETFDNAISAEKFKSLCERVGGREARRILLEDDSAPAERREMPSLAEWLDSYLDPESGMLSGVTEGTRDGYRGIAALSFLARIGHLRVNEITADSVRAWMNWQVAQPSRRSAGEMISAKTVKNYHALLSQALRAAVERGLVSENVAYGLELPKPRKRQMVCLQESEFTRIIVAASAQYRPLLLALAGTGMRFGEATALTWGDLIEVDGEWCLSVTKAWKKGPRDTRYIGEPKSEAGTRVISIGTDLKDALGERRGERELIFKNRAGNRVRISAFTKFALQSAVEKSKLGRSPRVHDLRHSHASWLIARNVPLPYIQQRLGHERIDTTIRVYGHLLPEALKATRVAAVVSIASALKAVQQA